VENVVYNYVDNSLFVPVDKFHSFLDLELSVLP